jgi:hypothetical protein
MQGNNKPLATMGNWATFFDNGEGANALRIKPIAPIATPHNCNEAP